MPVRRGSELDEAVTRSLGRDERPYFREATLSWVGGLLAGLAAVRGVGSFAMLKCGDLGGRCQWVVIRRRRVGDYLTPVDLPIFPLWFFQGPELKNYWSVPRDCWQEMAMGGVSNPTKKNIDEGPICRGIGLFNN